MSKIPLTISLPRDLYNAIERLSTLQGGSKSALIVSFLEPSLPAIQNMSDVFERIQKATPEERDIFMAQISESEKLAQSHLDVLNKLNEGLSND